MVRGNERSGRTQGQCSNYFGNAPRQEKRWYFIMCYKKGVHPFDLLFPYMYYVQEVDDEISPRLFEFLPQKALPKTKNLFYNGEVTM
ncbi:hypothetical protein PVK06_029822 [Gossypium arboreum]|uniref:Uncharacterized protein n=1 Tax=Gossypium arboreum TaxID=29729 RepID=A0ABR0NML4_GOSAR|nr:hypothetical protein PVK06_029822 [Gossypium arboreum]